MPDDVSDDQILDALAEGFGVSEAQARQMLAFYREETQGDDQVIDGQQTAAQPSQVNVRTEAAVIRFTTAGARIALLDDLSVSVWERDTIPAH